MEGYNGYKNWATWNVALWLNNDEGMYREMQRLVRFNPTTARGAEEFVTELLPNGTPDMDSARDYADVDWLHIAEVINENAPEEEADEDED
jgi:hypothetical protein